MSPRSVQGQWLRAALAASSAPYKVVYFHHAPFASGTHGDSPWMQWPFAAWGADLVLSGHEHHYERMATNGTDYVVNGIGGTYLRVLGSPRAGAAVGWDHDHGASFLLFDPDSVRLVTVAGGGEIVDRTRLLAGRPAAPEWPLVPYGSDWLRLEGTTPPPDGWQTAAFADASWVVGPAPLGYGLPLLATELDPGPNLLDRYPTVWLRKHFDGSSSAAFDQVRLDLHAEDGFVVWLNGEEVLRSNVAAGALAADAVAIAEGDPVATVSVALPAALVLPGDNVLAVELHHAAPDDAQLFFEGSLLAVRTERLVPFDATWGFLDDGVGPPDLAAWTQVGGGADFARGKAPFGFGAAVATEIDPGPDPLHHHRSAWFRTEFAVADAGAVDSLLLRLILDPGAVAYLNGTEIYRARMPASAPRPDTLALPAPLAAGWSEVFSTTWVDPKLLVDGPNVLAVETHLGADDQAAARFGAELIAF